MEICDSIDQNCNGVVDDGLQTYVFYYDGDSDGYGAGSGINSCSQPAGYTSNSGDCNDSNACTVDTCDTSGSGVGGVCVHVDTCASEAPSAAPTCGGDKIVVNILTDNYPGETTWTLENTCTNTQVMSGGPYSQGGTEFSQESCADTGKYRFTINDAYGGEFGGR